MKLGEIQKIYTALGTTLEKKLPLKVGFVINRNIKKMQPIIEDLDKTRDDAVNKYGEHDEEGKLIVAENGAVRISDAIAFGDAIAEVLDADIEIEFDKFSMEDLEKCELDGYDKLTVAEQGAVEVMIS